MIVQLKLWAFSYELLLEIIVSQLKLWCFGHAHHCQQAWNNEHSQDPYPLII